MASKTKSEESKATAKTKAGTLAKAEKPEPEVAKPAVKTKAAAKPKAIKQGEKDLNTERRTEPKIIQLLAAPAGMVKTVTNDELGTTDEIAVVCIGLLDNGETVKLTADDIGGC